MWLTEECVQSHQLLHAVTVQQCNAFSRITLVTSEMITQNIGSTPRFDMNLSHSELAIFTTAAYCCCRSLDYVHKNLVLFGAVLNIHTNSLSGGRDIVVGTVNMLRVGRSSGRFPAKVKDFSLLQKSRPTLQPIHLTIQWV